MDLKVALVACLLILLAVIVGATVAGLPNRAVQTRLDRMLDYQEQTLRRQTDLMLAGGDVPTFTALRQTDPILAPPGSFAEPDMTQREVNYDSPDDIPEYLGADGDRGHWPSG